MQNSVSLILLGIFAVSFQTASSYTGQTTLTLTNINSLQPYHPRRYKETGWSDVNDLLSCAKRTITEISRPVGFFFNRNIKLCTPVIGFGEPGMIGTSEYDEEEGHLYLFKKDCPYGFLFYETNDFKTCLRFSTDMVNYEDATSTCKSWGGRLMAPKTTTKLELVRDISLSNGMSFWIGLDDILQESKFIWQLDGTELTSEQKDTLFKSTEPNGDTRENCVEFRKQTSFLNDIKCSYNAGFICEALDF